MTAPDARFSEASRLSSSPIFRDCVARHANLAPPGSRRLCMRLHPGDQMLLHSLESFEADTASSQYFNVATQQFRAARQVIGVLGRDAHSCRLLDFACGYGRLLRFLTVEKPPSEIWASEIQKDALEFVAAQFGVNVSPSSADPAAFRPPADFQVIWVASLFSHLPRELFHAWLAKLLASLAHEGILAFSVKDMSLRPAGGEGDFAYLARSENAELDTAIYGTTWVTEGFVAGALAAHPAFRYFRIPRGLASDQDLYVVARRDLSSLRSFRRGPWGFVDLIRASADRHLHLAGWAASLDDATPPRVSVRVDGSSRDCPIKDVRTDVGEFLRDARYDQSGWEYQGRLPDERTFVEVCAETRPGESALLYAGFL